MTYVTLVHTLEVDSEKMLVLGICHLPYQQNSQQLDPWTAILAIEKSRHREVWPGLSE